MSAIAETTHGADDPGTHGDHHVVEGHDHPTDRQYVMVALFLAAVTALEVSTYWVPEDWPAAPVVASLIVMMVIKFAFVIGWFMHLKFDARLFRRVFVFGLVLAVAVYGVALTSMVFWTDSGIPEFDDPPPALEPTADDTGS